MRVVACSQSGVEGFKVIGDWCCNAPCNLNERTWKWSYRPYSLDPESLHQFVSIFQFGRCYDMIDLSVNLLSSVSEPVICCFFFVEELFDFFSRRRFIWVGPYCSHRWRPHAPAHRCCWMSLWGYSGQCLQSIFVTSHHWYHWSTVLMTLVTLSVLLTTSR